jgi:hypothetical protein
MRSIVLDRSKLLGFRICNDSMKVAPKIGLKVGVQKRQPVRLGGKVGQKRQPVRLGGKVGFKRTWDRSRPGA